MLEKIDELLVVVALLLLLALSLTSQIFDFANKLGQLLVPASELLYVFLHSFGLTLNISNLRLNEHLEHALRLLNRLSLPFMVLVTIVLVFVLVLFARLLYRLLLLLLILPFQLCLLDLLRLRLLNWFSHFLPL